MKVLLTGASGFVGSHILDTLCERGIPTAVLLRPTSQRNFIERQLQRVEVRLGSIDDPASLHEALREVTHIIHCAGATKALRAAEFYEVNQTGTRNVVEAVNAQRGQVQRLVHISSLAAAGPALPGQPARESDPPQPVSEYGRSKLAGEREVTGQCQADFVVLRPPAVYGPRDGEFLRLFKAVKSHLRPRFGGGRQALSFVFVKDLADTAVAVLTAPAAARQTYFVAAQEIATARELTEEIAVQMGVWTLPLPLPTALLWPVCAVQELLSRLTGKPNVLSRQKYAELRAPAWTCDASKLRRELGLECRTNLKAGLGTTQSWYREQGWL
ncbi:MAG: NAD(P)-dependent oxidoreductase [Verrucomicrobia bacterium]|nr:NAD(P)-dependent oxidoreductase [Verrucomicrobiota bacterium]